MRYSLQPCDEEICDRFAEWWVAPEPNQANDPVVETMNNTVLSLWADLLGGTKTLMEFLNGCKLAFQTRHGITPP